MTKESRISPRIDRAITSTIFGVSLFLAVAVIPAAAQDRGPVNGARALERIRGRLPEVALKNRMAPEVLRSILENDSTANLDDEDQLLYIDEAPSPEELEEADATRIKGKTAGTFPAGVDVFKLHSRPSAQRTIYLDFDGHILQNTAWNNTFGQTSVTCPAYDTDGNPSAFGTTERSAIYQIWERVAEDFAAHNVDVTTEILPEPGTGIAEGRITRTSTSDPYFGTRVLISPISNLYPNAGGVAYVGAFDDYGSSSDRLKPALVFPEKLGSGNPKYVAEACSHEAGHNLGLSHDGTTLEVQDKAYYKGHGDWAPIMGNSYHVNVTQWSKGEYPNATNTQDDLGVMAQTGLPLVPDDYGNSFSTAYTLPVQPLSETFGIIGLNRDGQGVKDIDMFKVIAGNGPAEFGVYPQDNGPNVNLKLELFNASGTSVAASNPTTALSAAISISNLAAGEYFLAVSGQGQGDLTTGYSDYASGGNFLLSVTVGETSEQPATPTPTATAVNTAQPAPTNTPRPTPTATATATPSPTPNGEILPDVYEPNDSLPSARFLGKGNSFAISGLTLHSGSDQDYFRITANRSTGFKISVTPLPGSQADPVLTIMTTSAQVINPTSTSNGPVYRLQKNTSYLIFIRSQSGTTFGYSFSMTVSGG